MKYLLLFMFCISLSSFETSSHFVQNQVVLNNNNTITREKLSYKQRVMVKYLKLKARFVVNHRTKLWVIVGSIFLVLGIFLVSVVGAKKNYDAFVGYGLGLVSLCLSFVAFMLAIMSSI